MLKPKVINAALMCLFSGMVSAATLDSHILVTPKCLLKNIETSYKLISEQGDFALIEANEQTIAELNTFKHKKANCGGFVDATSEWQSHNARKLQPRPPSFLQQFLTQPEDNNKATYKIQYEKEVHQVLGATNPQNMWTNLTTLSNYKDRYADSQYGIDAANWLKSQMEVLIKETNHESDTSVSFIKTNGYKQPSLIVKFGTSNEPGIVVGAHMDTLSSTRGDGPWNPVNDPTKGTIKPGADDDGTGSVTILETARTILSSGMHFKKPIYFMWYAAEEEGLVGSKNVVQEFKDKNIPIGAVLHFDMTGYTYPNDPSMWLITDFVNQDLTNFLETLITTYVKQTVKKTRCGYGCSDHASWTRKGFPSAIAAETKFENTNPNMHTSRDTMDKLSLTHMTDYLKLALSFAVELAEPTPSVNDQA